jgi:micrococcal nuclease
MLEGQEVGLEFDVERLDRFGRTLAYVWLDDQLFNEVLVARGFAHVSTYPPNVKYVDVFLEAQREARSAERGLWGTTCKSELPPGIPPPPVTGGGGNCDHLHYPGVCIAPYPPDLDCADVPYTNFKVIGSDPHGFDGNDNGVGCET